MTGYKFKSKGGIDYIVVGGKEGGVIAFEQEGSKGVLCFGCDAKITGDGLCISYNVSYGVTKQKFFDALKNNTFYERYYKVPKVFLRLIEEMYEEEKR